MKYFINSFFVFFYFFLFSYNIYSQDLSSFQKIRSNPRLQSQLQNWVTAVIQEWEGKKENLQEPSDAIFQKPLAVFVTAKKNGEVRGCMGTLIPHEKNLAEEIRRNLKLAFQQDPRHRPIQKDELPGMEIYISAVSNQKLLSKPYQIDPARDAILIKSGSKEAIALPGEAKTTRYLLAFLKAKAGIKKGEKFQLYSMESESIRTLPAF